MKKKSICKDAEIIQMALHDKDKERASKGYNNIRERVD